MFLTRSAAALGASLLAGLGAALLSASAGAEPPPPPEPRGAVAGLVFDLDKMVEAQTSLGWTIDRYEYEDLLPSAVLSVCSTTDATRADTRAYLSARAQALGAPVEEAFRRAGGDIDAIEDLLFATRTLTLLEEALRRAPEECPFWLRPNPAFHGLQIDAYRYTLNLEGGGLLVLQRAGGKLFFGGGGAGRLLLGRGLDPRWTFLAGAEVGGQALFDQSATETHFPIGLHVALPLVLRHHDLTWHYDFELTPFGYFTQIDTRVSPGLRTGFLLGISALRIRNIMPWAGLGASFEYVFDTYVRPAQWSVKSGARVGFDWDF